MNTIHIPQYNILVQGKSSVATVVRFVEELASKNRLILDRIYSYMAQEYMPKHNTHTHVVARSKEAWNYKGKVGKSSGKDLQLTNTALTDPRDGEPMGWYLYTNLAPKDLTKGILKRIEEALNGGRTTKEVEATGMQPIKIYAYLGSSVGQHGVMHYTEEDIRMMGKTNGEDPV